ncbi:type II secretion system F family protein [Geobacillus sp. C56-T2]|uniref:type II secretion system F family protein n=1 Tax=Geobacillus sp. C56-T2 TaxID=600773 RepID=UPI0011A9F502|nr:type II secretion system F family protein [Geobacillus sp. C56-T2]NNV06325.1 type II secretion system F family protein [Geobacillus sp. MMMUD3]
MAFLNIQMNAKRRKVLTEKIMGAGLAGKWTPLDVYSLQLILPVAVCLFYLMLALASGESSFYIFALALSPLSYALPVVWLNGEIRKRKETISRELPHYVNSIAIMCEAGLNLFPAIKEVATRKKGVLSEELKQVIYEVSLGIPQTEALERMAERCQIDEVSRFVSAVNQTLERGSSGITAILRQQAT